MEKVHVVEVRDVPVTAISEHPRNANRGNIGEIATRLREMGQYRTIVVHADTGHILAGNSTYRAARDQLGWTHIRAEFVRCSDERALEILAWDNRARDKSLGYDQSSLLELLTAIEQNGSLSLAGYDQGNLDDLAAALEETGGTAVADALGDPIQTASRKTIDEMATQYETTKTRMVMLMFSNPVYVWVVEQLKDLAERWDVDNSPDVLVRLLADATGAQAPEAD
jgi:hypothetical protein